MDFSVTTFKERRRDSGMIDVNKLPEFPGFTVYDAETGNHVNYHVSDGDNLFVGKNEVLAEKGKYIIQMGDGTYYRW